MSVLQHRWIALLAGLLTGLTACSAPHERPSAAEAASSHAVCRLGPDGGPPAPGTVPGIKKADRGIGGTGSPMGVPTDVSTALLTGERGIGGTGIVGVVTGFASICVDGLEVAYDDSAKVDIDGASADAAQLRAGDVVAVRAEGADTAMPAARSISVRIEASGRIDGMPTANGQIRVAGQPVLVAAGVPGADRVGPGDWVSVSGLRRGDGVIVATRLDAAPPDKLSARGIVRSDGDGPHLGTLRLPGSTKAGEWVHVTGTYVDGEPRLAAVTADTLCPNPYRCFEGALNRLIVQAYVHSEGSRVRVGEMLLQAQGAVAQAKLDGVAIVALERRSDGRYTAVDIGTPPVGAPVKAPEAGPPPPSDPVRGQKQGPKQGQARREAANDTASSIASLSAQPAMLGGRDMSPGAAATQTAIPPPEAITQTANAVPVLPSVATPAGPQPAVTTATATAPDPLVPPPVVPDVVQPWAPNQPMPSSGGASPGSAGVPISSHVPPRGGTLLTGSATQVTSPASGMREGGGRTTSEYPPAGEAVPPSSMLTTPILPASGTDLGGTAAAGSAGGFPTSRPRNAAGHVRATRLH